MEALKVVHHAHRRSPLLTTFAVGLLSMAAVAQALILPVHAPTFFDDFNDGDDDGWQVISGSWDASTGQYIGEGDGLFPPGDFTVIQSLLVQDLLMEVAMTSLVRVDKFVVLRFQDLLNMVVVNFRASPFDDIVVQEEVGGRFVIHGFRPNPVSDQLGLPLQVRVELMGQHLKVFVADALGESGLAIDETFPFSVRTGQVGLGVVDDAGGSGRTAFDNVRVQVRDCEMTLELQRSVFHTGDLLRARIEVNHRRPFTVTVPLLLWIEDADGREIARLSSRPIVMEPGDRVAETLAVALPEDLSPGEYRVLVGVEKMQQGLAGVSRRFRVVG